MKSGSQKQHQLEDEGEAMDRQNITDANDLLFRGKKKKEYNFQNIFREKVYIFHSSEILFIRASQLIVRFSCGTEHRGIRALLKGPAVAAGCFCSLNPTSNLEP